MDEFFGVLWSLLLAAGFCLLTIPLFKQIAVRIDLVDKPTLRKQHHGEVPVIGGVAIYIATLFSMLILYRSVDAVLPLLLAFGLVVVGVIDDRIGLTSLVRFPVQIGVATLMVSFSQGGIVSVGDLFGQGAVEFSGAASLAFTIMCVVGVINSINMLDGIDGLSGVIVCITLSTLAIFSAMAGDMVSVSLIVGLIGSTCVFLFFNSRMFRKRATIFLGDAGSTMFGLVVVWYFIKLTQYDNAVLSPVAAGWIFGLPLMDTVAVMVGRIMDKRSPFDADRSHLHHRVLDAGFSVNQTVLYMALVHMLFVSLGILCNQFRSYEQHFFWGFVALVVLHFFFTPVLLSRCARVFKLVR